MAILVVKNVSKKYKTDGQTREVLKDINFSVQAGDFINLRGSNGSGKSTLINSILGLQQVDRGTIEIFGLPPECPRSRLRVGCMLQRARAPQHLKVEELINLVGSYYPNPLSTEEILTRANLQERRQNKASDLSGGEERSLYFALAIAGNPDLLILDEPTNDLSVTARAKLWQQIKDFNREGKTIIIVTHQESDVQEMKQSVRRVLELNTGKLEEIPQDRPVNLAPSSRSTPPQEFRLLSFPLGKAFLSQVKVELLNLLKQPSFLLTAIILCILPISATKISGYNLAAFIASTAFSLFVIAVERFGVQIATEQTQGWTKLLRVTSLPAWVYIGSKVIATLFVSILVLLLILAFTFGGMNITFEQNIGIPLISSLLLGTIPFMIIGCAIGYLCNTKTVTIVSAIVIIVGFLMSFPSSKISWLQQLIPYSPFYHYAQLQLWAGKIDTVFNNSVYDEHLVLHILWLFCTAGIAIIVAQWAYNRDIA